MQEPRVLKLLTFRTSKIIGPDDQINFIKIFVFELGVDATSNIQPIVAIVIKVTKSESAIKDEPFIATLYSLTLYVG